MEEYSKTFGLNNSKVIKSKLFSDEREAEVKEAYDSLREKGTFYLD